MKARIYRAENGYSRALLRESDSFGIPELDLVSPPRRFWDDRAPSAPALLEIGLDASRIPQIPTPTEILSSLPEGDNWTAMSRRSLQRLSAWFLICEDPQGRLRAQEVASLAHQTTLVQHVLTQPNLNRVLVADEVGLGKTVEAGLIIQRLLANSSMLRVLYLTPARLVRNVQHEFDRLGLPFRQWVAGDDSNATLKDPRVVASIHRAVHPSHFKSVVESEPWDLIVVDECHHLSAWEPNGGKPVRQYRLVEELAARQGASSRLILMSGTPHQGHRERFRNLLGLLKAKGEGDEALIGRVIYRTKDDVKDWFGNPVFPARQVNEPTVIDLGDHHRRWLRSIHDFYVQPSALGRGKDSRKRAAGWRTAQALQWASSSVNAGLGYLIRQALRAGWTLENPSLRRALELIRPYRLGPDNEPLESLHERISKEVARQVNDADIDDIEDIDEETDRWEPDPLLLANLLTEGVSLLSETRDLKWHAIHERLLRPAGREKVVLFAQPIETVTALAGYLERVSDKRPALIIGDQSQADRDREIENFWRLDGPQFLVSSRAGGEGINLQVARRLVHVDVPWNPMELEQRVGRVHRFGSRQLILVDTVVAKDSREVDMYRVARGRLNMIANALVPADRFESLFARVMSLVPPEELQAILGEAPLAPLSAEEEGKISDLVSEGFQNWREFHDRYSDQRMDQLDPGHASWDDLINFVTDHLGVHRVPGFTSLQFRWEAGAIEGVEVNTPVLRLGDNQFYACGDFAGMPITGPNGEAVKVMGLNVPSLASALRQVAFPREMSGAAHVRWPADVPLPKELTKKPFAVWIAAKQTLRLGPGTASEVGSTLIVYVATDSNNGLQLAGESKSCMIRQLLSGTIRRDPEPNVSLVASLKENESRWFETLRRPTDEERSSRIVHAVTPLLAAICNLTRRCIISVHYLR